MNLSSITNWEFFPYLFGVTLVVTFIMMRLSVHFYTKGNTVKKFSIMELEMPATGDELVKLIAGIFALTSDKRRKSLWSLRAQLWIDFLFMPLAYGCIAFLCVKVSQNLSPGFGRDSFVVLAAAQVLPWLFDIIENIYLLRKIQLPPTPSSKTVHRNYLVMEICKWAIALIAITCALSLIAYFWLAGKFHHATPYLLVSIVEIVIFAALVWLSGRNDGKTERYFFGE